MSIRTDLAIDEKIEGGDISGVIKKIKTKEYITVTDIQITDEEAAKQLNKPKGRYITLEFPPLSKLSDYSPLIGEIEESLNYLLQDHEKGVLVAGLGNSEITPDAVGPNTAKRILATRHIKKDFAEKIGLKGLKSVAVITPDVLGKTGIEASESVEAAVEKINPGAIIAIDALCSKSLSRLFTAVQISDTGISPGSGVKNARKELSRNSLKVPVIAVGVPTVVDASVIAYELTGKESQTDTDLIVTPKDIDYLCEKMCEILSKALNLFLQPEIPPEVLESLA